MAFINFTKKVSQGTQAQAGPTSAFRANCVPSGTQLPPSGAWQQILFTEEVFDVNNEFANNLFCPTGSGEYNLHARLTIQDLPAGEGFQARIVKNNSQIIALSEFELNASSGILDVGLEVAGTTIATSGDCFKVEARQTDLFPHQLVSSGFECFFDGWKLEVGLQGPPGPPGPPGAIVSGVFVEEDLSSQIGPSRNKDFTLSFTPISGTLSVFWNGVKQAQKSFASSGQEFTTGFCPYENNVIVAQYFSAGSGL